MPSWEGGQRGGEQRGLPGPGQLRLPPLGLVQALRPNHPSPQTIACGAGDLHLPPVRVHRPAPCPGRRDALPVAGPAWSDELCAGGKPLGQGPVTGTQWTGPLRGSEAGEVDGGEGE